MSQPALDRRTFLAFGFSGGLYTLGGFGTHVAAADGPIVLKPFAHSRTVSNFAECLFLHEEAMPLALRRTIDAEFARTDTVSEAPAQERKRAAFFARLAVQTIAPRALLSAGYKQMAIDVANGTLSPSGAQHTIGWQYANCRTLPKLALCAYGATAHASTTAFYASREDIMVVVEAGDHCALSLLDASFYDDEIVVADAAWIWNFAAMVINAALDLSSDKDVQLESTLLRPA